VAGFVLKNATVMKALCWNLFLPLAAILIGRTLVDLQIPLGAFVGGGPGGPKIIRKGSDNV